MITSVLRPLAAQLIAVLVLLSYSLAGPADQNDPALDSLFDRLATTSSAEEASDISNEIWQRWSANDDPDVSQLMEIGIRALNYSTYRKALRSFDRIIEMAPQFAEAWNKRATLYYHIREYRRSIDDIKETLRLEPRHYGHPVLYNPAMPGIARPGKLSRRTGCLQKSTVDQSTHTQHTPLCPETRRLAAARGRRERDLGGWGQSQNAVKPDGQFRHFFLAQRMRHRVSMPTHRITLCGQ